MIKVKNKKLILASLALAAVLVGGGVYAYSRNSGEENDEAKSTEEQKNPYSPPTAEEKKAGDQAKEKFDSQSNSNENNDDNVKSVKPEIIYHGIHNDNLEVSSRVPDIIEDSGKCTLSLEKDGKTRTQTRDAVPNVSEMSCGIIKIPTSKLSSGTWVATVTYSSSKAKGTSDKVSIDVK